MAATTHCVHGVALIAVESSLHADSGLPSKVPEHQVAGMASHCAYGKKGEENLRCVLYMHGNI